MSSIRLALRRVLDTAAEIGISPDKRATTLHDLYRQIVITPPPNPGRDVDLSGKTTIAVGASVDLGLENESIVI